MESILVVDDTIANLRFVVDCLLEDNYQVLTANNGELAIKVALQKQPDLILMDWEMPVMDGLTAIREIKKQASISDIPIIMYTGVNTDAGNLQKALQAGAIDFLRKPVDPVELRARIKNILSLQEYYKEKMEAERQQAALALKLRKEELTNLAIIIEEKNSFLEGLQEEIEQLKSLTDSSKQRTAIRQLIQKIELDINSETQWELLKVRVNNLHNNFINKLQEKHPDLSSGDLKLASLIRIKLSNQEISDNLQIARASVEKKKTRLRKKLGLDSAKALDDYLSKFV
jgi:CheY-like chemotaxis protein